MVPMDPSPSLQHSHPQAHAHQTPEAGPSNAHSANPPQPAHPSDMFRERFQRSIAQPSPYQQMQQQQQQQMQTTQQQPQPQQQPPQHPQHPQQQHYRSLSDSQTNKSMSPSSGKRKSKKGGPGGGMTSRPVGPKEQASSGGAGGGGGSVLLMPEGGHEEDMHDMSGHHQMQNGYS